MVKAGINDKSNESKMNRTINTLKHLLPIKWLLLACFSFSSSLSAHPHAWVDTNTAIGNDKTHITTLHMTWTFDAETSDYMLQGEEISPEHIDNTLQLLATSVTNNMYNEHYFTYFYVGNTPIKFKTARYPQLIQYQDKLVLTFDIPLSEPIAFNNKDFKLFIYDSTYFVDMSWLEAQDIQLTEDISKHCKYKLLEPTASDAQRAYTLSLADDVAPNNALGQLFSQQFQLHCD